MAGNKISALGELTLPADGDLWAVVDASDVTQGAGGTTKKIRLFADVETQSAGTVLAPPGSALRNRLHAYGITGGTATMAAPSGSALPGAMLLARLKDDGTAWPLAYNAVFRDLTGDLPAITTAGKVMYLVFASNVTDGKWDFLGPPIVQA